MPTVKFTANLKRFYPDLEPMVVTGKTVASVLEEVNDSHAGLKDYIVDENGILRQPNVKISILSDLWISNGFIIKPFVS